MIRYLRYRWRMLLLDRELRRAGRIHRRILAGLPPPRETARRVLDDAHTD